MMSYLKTFFAVGISAFLVGCATTKPASNASQQKTIGQKPSALLVADSNTAILTIARAGTVGYALKANISVDGDNVGSIKNKQYLSVPITPGSHEIKLKFNPLSLQKGASITLEAEAGQTYVYRITSSTSGTVGGAYGNNLTNTFRFVPSSEGFVTACCQLIEGP